MTSLRTYCVAREAPLLPPQLIDCVVGPESVGGDPAPNAGFWADMKKYAPTAGSLYAIPAHMDEVAPSRLAGLCSQRKFVVRTRIGQPSTDLCHEIGLDEGTAIGRADIEPRPGFEFLVSHPIKFEEGIVTQYINAHHGIDLFDHLSLAVEIGALSFNAANAYASEEIFIPGACELGVYPTAWLRSTLIKLELISREFLRRCVPRLQRYDTLQMRAVEFLAERLGSFLLLTELNERYSDEIPRDVYGFMCAVAPSTV